jgi:transcription elongation factor Elf1
MDQRFACPTCGSDLVVPIVYGFADAGMAMEEDAGRLLIGGCDITDNDPQWACRACESRW